MFSFFIQIAIICRGLFSFVTQLIKRLSHHIFSGLTPHKGQPQQVLAIANHVEFEELSRFLTTAGVRAASLNQVLPNTPPSFKIQPNTTIILCQGPDFSWKQVIAQTEKLGNKHLSLRFHAKNSQSIIGSDSKETSGEAMANPSPF